MAATKELAITTTTNKADERVYSIQPRFVVGDQHGGWATVAQGVLDVGGVLGERGFYLPPVGSPTRDMYLAYAWQDEPIMAGCFGKWAEKTSTTNWKITGTKVNARRYANMIANADGGRGWTWTALTGSIDYLTTDKGWMLELGRADDNVLGPVLGINHIDSARMVKLGNPGYSWRYYPEHGSFVDVPDANLIHIPAMPSPREDLLGHGLCATSRLVDAKRLMLGYLNYLRQEIGDIPPEMILIFNNMSQTKVQTSLGEYRRARRARGLDIYSKIWLIGNDNPQTPVNVTSHPLLSPNKSFNYPRMVEWYVQVIAVETGEAVSFYWLKDRSANTNTIQSVQALKASGAGIGTLLYEIERQFNRKVMPSGAYFEFDNADDDQDKARADIMATNVGTLKTMADIVVGEDPVFSKKELREIALRIGVLRPEMAEDLQDDTLPTIVGSTLKSLYSPDFWRVDRYGNEERLAPVLRG